MFWVIKKIVWIILLNNFAFIHKDDPIRNLFSKAHFVTYNQHRHARVGEFNHNVKNFFNHFRIKG